jgi:hypothetical protein
MEYFFDKEYFIERLSGQAGGDDMHTDFNARRAK